MGRMSVLLGRRYPLRIIHQVEGEPRLHGHDYDLNITITGPVDPESGMILNRDWLDQVVQESLIKPFDRKNLNEHLPSGSGEQFSELLFKIARKTPLAPYLVSIELQETQKNIFVSYAKNLKP